MIQVAQKKKDRVAARNVEFQLGDVTEVLRHYPDKSFDVATICMALHGMPKLFRVPILKEMARVSKQIQPRAIIPSF